MPLYVTDCTLFLSPCAVFKLRLWGRGGRRFPPRHVRYWTKYVHWLQRKQQIS